MPVSATKIKEIAKVKELFNDSEGSAGARSIAQMATDQDIPLSRYRASRLMKKLGLISCQIPAHTYKKTGHEHVEISNELDLSSIRMHQTVYGAVTSLTSGRGIAGLT